MLCPELLGVVFPCGLMNEILHEPAKPGQPPDFTQGQAADLGGGTSTHVLRANAIAQYGLLRRTI